MPVARNVTVGGDSFSQVDRLSAWDCTLSIFTPMGDVPQLLKVKWGRVVAEALRRLEEATSEAELTRALQWWQLLPQAFLRQSKRGGQKGQGAAQIAARFQAALEGDWGRVIDQLEADKVAEEGRQEARRLRGGHGPETEEKKREVVMGKVTRGQVGKAAARIVSPGLASVESPEVMDTLRAKFVARGRPLPTSVTRGQSVDQIRELREALLDLERGSASGPGGMKPDFLIALGEVLEEEDMARLEQHSLRCLNGDYPAWFHTCLGAVTTVPLYKNKQCSNSQIRPLGVASCFVRCIERISAQQNRQIFQAYLEPQQQALSTAGAHRLVNMVRMALEEHPDWVCLKLDVENAHSSIARAAILEVLEQEPDLRHMAWSCASSLAAPTTLEVGGKVWGEAGDGVLQGKPSSGQFFASGWHPEVQELDREVGTEGGAARMFSDDGYEALSG